ncbi:hypothetical protein [Haliangium sp.]|uniref:hypothetical protein n=1 Tax=Haliangium sp. TaxID=2663208 RepID=UPI003D0A0638
MSSPRQQRLRRFRDAILADEREEAHDTLFRVLYGLPADVQIDLARALTARFLPIFRANHPEVTWPETVLVDLHAYYSEHGQALYDEPEDSFGGDMSFHYALYALLRALSHAEESHLYRVTPACCTALLWAVAARARNVWHADDPEAVQAFELRDREALAGRTMHDNVASRAVTKREWLIVADWLDEHQIGDYPEADEDERERWLAWWQERECLL